jgi:hypothetical protein
MKILRLVAGGKLATEVCWNCSDDDIDDDDDDDDMGVGMGEFLESERKVVGRWT